MIVRLLSYLTPHIHNRSSSHSWQDEQHSCFQVRKCWKMGAIQRHFLPVSPGSSPHPLPSSSSPTSTPALLKTNGSRAVTECLVYKSPPLAALLVQPQTLRPPSPPLLTTLVPMPPPPPSPILGPSVH
ncbi:hypothetical protein DPEC_G00002900 [Dallia pectoralis]|uniref:Uncharacterized protein n=1 Tax=Dallia pectoralis TaxID=75939 RepID=A0ACC2HK84_DALPE|nr:hypothetical protein DPEC_G00002900 [Dallia pectoralis]